MDLFSFRGRANRQEFWFVGFGLTVVMLLLTMFAGMLLAAVLPDLDQVARAWEGLGLSLVVSLLFLWPILAVGVRRAHDRGHSGRWFVVSQVLVMALNLWAMVATIRGAATESAEMLVVDLASLGMLVWLLFLLVTLGFLKGDRGPNKYGPPAGRSDNYRSPTI